MERLYARTGLRGVIYISPAFWAKYAGDTTWFADNGYKVLWIAHWTTAVEPTVAAADWGGRGWTFWQYTSSGAVPGIAGRVDLDRYAGSDFKDVLIP
jgi:lysozyme